MSLQVPLQDANANVLMPVDLQMQKQQMLFMQQQQIALGLRTDEKSYSSRWSSRLPLPHGVSIELQNRELWQQFHAETTEMIITKSGRRMFPSIQIAVNGLNKHDFYFVLIEIASASNRRHKYCGNGGGSDENRNKSNNIGGWSFAGPAEPQPQFDRRIFIHPDGPNTGEHWMQSSINFSKLKLTNNVVDHRNNVVLTSMHKYVPTIWIIRCASASNLNDLFSHPASSFAFKETEFIAVTAYQNEKITKLKINNNPFAKGFRETGQSRCKRKYHQISHADRTDDEESNSLDSSESNPSASNLDDLAQKSEKRSEVKNSNDCDDIKPLVPIAGDQRSSPKPESDHHECEMPSPFHRPWLDSPSRKPLVPMVLMIPSAPLVPSFSSMIHDLNWSSHYFQSLPYITQQNLVRYYQYHCPSFHVRKL